MVAAAGNRGPEPIRRKSKSKKYWNDGRKSVVECTCSKSAQNNLRVPMPEPVAQYGLGETEFQWAIKVLDQVEKALQLPWWQQWLYKLYGVFISALVVSCISVVTIIISFWLGVKSTSDVPGVLLISSGLIALLAFLGALFFIPLNLPLLLKVRQQK